LGFYYWGIDVLLDISEIHPKIFMIIFINPGKIEIEIIFGILLRGYRCVSRSPAMAFSDLPYLFCWAYIINKFIFSGLTSGFSLLTGISYRNPCHFLVNFISLQIPCKHLQGPIFPSCKEKSLQVEALGYRCFCSYSPHDAGRWKIILHEVQG
jgi:hypothetical protein